MKKFNPLFLISGFVASISTLLCCALPIILVSLGFGSIMAALISHLPWLIWISEHAIYFFVLTFFLLLISGYMLFYQPLSCTLDRVKQCQSNQTKAKIIWLMTLIIFIIGLIFKYILIYFI
ncbi:MAG: hypothetical protein CMF42_00915 [Legionellales bacterium]|nr:hypothetical protein [Legionellales bacterium]